MNLPTSINQMQNKQTQQCDLAELRLCLSKLGSWPEAGDEYLSLMTSSLWDRIAIRDQDFEWVSKVAADAQKGIDIGLVYPSFFQKLVANGKLRTAFVQRLKRV